jgi:hypothetical protein
VTSELRLDRAVFEKRVVVEAEAGTLSVDDARFEDGVALRVRHARVSVQRSFSVRPRR